MHPKPEPKKRSIETLQPTAEYSRAQLATAAWLAYALNSKRFVLVEPPNG